MTYLHSTPLDRRGRGATRPVRLLAVSLILLAVAACQTPAPSTAPPGTPAASPGGAAASAPMTPLPSTASAPAAGMLQGQWTRLTPAAGAPPPAARRDHTLTVDPDRGLIYLFGGRAQGFDAMDDLWAFDPATGVWRQVPVSGPRPPARFGHNAFYDAPRKRLVVAVGQASPTGFFNDVWAYDPENNSWKQLGEAAAEHPALRYGAGGASAGQGEGFLISHGFTNMGRFDDSWSFDPAGETWRKVTTSGAVPVKRCLTQAFWDPKNGRMLLFGGQANAEPFLGDFWALDVARGVWTEQKPAVLPGPRNLFGAAEDERAGRWYIFGGNTQAGPVADVWSYDAAQEQWSKLDVAGAPDSPAGRHGSDIAVVGDRLYLFGGNDSKTDLNDTWALALSGGE